ncbi:ABC transporter substrate-binding protein [Konateibacter massiliensis]|uniref:ABC transporter substrate-binding protein n=1 Tax=Konateibacter massiliensis TaxID=2002841 RepID=UPI000C15DDE3|nr:extracellular solute-binding protein [Konateibacter massiliensis]
MKKKLLSTMLTVVLASSMLAGCGGSKANTATDAEATTTDTATTEATTTETASSGDNELTVWCWDPAFNINAMQEAEKIYQKDHPDFKLNIVETPWADIQTKLTTAATSGQLDTLPDILLMQDGAFQKNVMSYPEAFTDLTGSSIDFTQFAAGKTGFSTVESKNYGVPFDNGAVIACYRTDVLEQAGYTVDDFTDITFSDYLTKGKDVLAKTGKPLLSCIAGESDVLVMMLQSAGGSFFAEDGSANIVDNAILKEVMEVYQEMVKAGVLIEVNDWDQYIATINNGTVASAMNGCWIMASIQAATDQAGKWGVTNMPRLEKAATATNYANQGGSSWAVTSNCKNVDLATDFLGSTFGGSTELYDNILSTGALATYLPAGDSAAYAETNNFFGEKPIYTQIVVYAGRIPACNTGVYFYEARDAVATAITNSLNGSDIDTELKTAEDTVNFAMSQ